MQYGPQDPISRRINNLTINGTSNQEAEAVRIKMREIVGTVDRLAGLNQKADSLKKAIEELTADDSSARPEISLQGGYPIPIEREVALAMYRHALERTEAEVRQLAARVDAIHKAIKSF
jgi:hypothetical protein